MYLRLAWPLLLCLLLAACIPGKPISTPAPQPTPLVESPSPSPSPPSPALVPTSAPPLQSPTPAVTVAHRSEAEALGERAFDHLRQLLQQAAPRDTESGAERRATEYLLARLRAWGYQVQLQEFSVTRYAKEPPRLTLLLPREESLEAEPLSQSGVGEATGVLVAVGLAREGDLPSEGLKGKIALIERGETLFQEKVTRVATAGTLAAVIYNNRPGPFSGSLTGRSPIPAIGISQEDGERLLELAGQGVQVRVVIKEVQLPSQNILAEKRGTDLDPRVVIIGGHYDTVPGVPGANDNGSGTALVLALAEALKDQTNPFTIRFMGFGAEELGLLGSRHYASTLSPEERGRIIAVLNFDVVAASIPLGIEGDSALLDRFQKLARDRGITLEQMTLRGGASDHVSFLRAGVPAVLITTPDFSRIHTPQDTLERLSPQRMAEAAALTLAYLESLGLRSAP